MATLAERSPNTASYVAVTPTAWESGGWGLLLIPILVCVAMLIFATVSSALPARSETPSRICTGPYEPRPVTGC